MPSTGPSEQHSSVPGTPGLPGGSAQIEPTAIPRLVNSLQESLDQVGVQIEHAITELRIRPWAGDPVSSQAAEQFNERSVGSGEDALTALCGYRDQLQAAADALTQAGHEYHQIDQASATGLGG